MVPEARRLGIVVLNWNGAEVLPACLNSLRSAAEASRHEVSVLLVDNDSRDDFVSMAEELWPELAVLRNEENLLFGGGMNRGLDYWLDRKQDFVLLLNNDIKCDVDFLDPLVEDLERDPRRGAASPRIHYLDPADRLWYGGGKVSRLARITSHRGIRKRPVEDLLRSDETGYLTGCAILGRRDFWKETGGFDPAFPFYAEDVDLSLRAREQGWLLRYVAESMIFHRVGFSSGGGMAPAKLRAQLTASGKLIRRHVSAPWRPLARLAWTLHLALAILRALFRGEWSVLPAAGAALVGREKP